jgi:hypothetical protein
MSWHFEQLQGVGSERSNPYTHELKGGIHCEISSSHGGEYDVQNCSGMFPDDGGSMHL